MISTALGSLRSNPVRSLLTSFGVAVGVAAIVTLTSLATGIGNYVRQQFESMLNASAFDISMHNPGFDDYQSMMRSRSWPTLTADLAEDMAGLMTTDQAVSWSGFSSGSVSSRGGTAEDVMIRGLSPSSGQVSGIDLCCGRFFTDSEDDAGARVCVLGSDLAEALGMDSDSLGARISLDGHRFHVIGIAAAEGSAFGRDLGGYVSIPYSSFENLFSRPDMDVRITVLPSSGSTLEECQDEARAILRSLRGLTVDEDDNFYFVTQEGILGSMNKVLSIAAAVTIGIAAISLLVGGIGIMNITLVSVTERTREIGTRRALGATRMDIVRQFMVEAIAVSALGGLAGFMVGTGLILVAGRLSPLPVEVNGWSAALAVGFSSLVGITFGIFPATKASMMDPVEALRYE